MAAFGSGWVTITARIDGATLSGAQSGGLLAAFAANALRDLMFAGGHLCGPDRFGRLTRVGPGYAPGPA